MNTVLNQPLDVLCVRSSDGVAGARSAFERLESALPTLKGRKFYGVLEADGVYRACVALKNDDPPPAAHLERWTLPGGLYLRARIKDWTNHIPEIAPTFAAMAAQCPRDPSRPSIEYYRSQEELILLLPIIS